MEPKPKYTAAEPEPITATLTLAQLQQVYALCERAIYASLANGVAEVTLKFKNGHPQAFGLQTWIVAEKGGPHE